MYIDHMVGNVELGQMNEWVKYYKEGLESMLSTTYSFDSIIGKNGTLVEAKRLAEKDGRSLSNWILWLIQKEIKQAVDSDKGETK